MTAELSAQIKATLICRLAHCIAANEAALVCDLPICAGFPSISIVALVCAPPSAPLAWAMVAQRITTTRSGGQRNSHEHNKVQCTALGVGAKLLFMQTAPRIAGISAHQLPAFA